MVLISTRASTHMTIIDFIQNPGDFYDEFGGGHFTYTANEEWVKCEEAVEQQVPKNN